MRTKMGVRSESCWTSHFPTHVKYDTVIPALQPHVAIRAQGALVPPESAHHCYIALAPISHQRCPFKYTPAWQLRSSVPGLAFFC